MKEEITPFQLALLVLTGLALIGGVYLVHHDKFKSEVICESPVPPNITQICPNITCEKQVCDCADINVSCIFPNNLNISISNSS